MASMLKNSASLPPAALWQMGLDQLRNEIPAQQYNTWLRPLQLADQQDHPQQIQILAPNRFIADWVKGKYLDRLQQALREGADYPLEVCVAVANQTQASALVPAQPEASPIKPLAPAILTSTNPTATKTSDFHKPTSDINIDGGVKHQSNINPLFTFDNFVEGKSNQLARAAALQVAENPVHAYNPLFIYGGVGLGKTHLMHAIGNALLKRNPNARVLYIHAERFLADMLKALQINAINEFKRFYRSVDALLIDDIQLIAGKQRTQEEFFYMFNALLEGHKQMVFTCDRYPREVDQLEERLRSRFSWGLPVTVEPPELETRVAILMKKAEEKHVALPTDVAFFIGQRIRSHVRELEGALNRVLAHARLTGRTIDNDLVKEALKDLFALQDKLVTVQNIQSTVAEYYKIKTSDLLAKRRNRSVARPRQVAMSLSKELTNHSLPEIGEAFGGRDHTTVLHACRKIRELRDSDAETREDYQKLLRALTT